MLCMVFYCFSFLWLLLLCHTFHPNNLLVYIIMRLYSMEHHGVLRYFSPLIRVRHEQSGDFAVCTWYKGGIMIRVWNSLRWIFAEFTTHRAPYIPVIFDVLSGIPCTLLYYANVKNEKYTNCKLALVKVSSSIIVKLDLLKCSLFSGGIAKQHIDQRKGLYWRRSHWSVYHLKIFEKCEIVHVLYGMRLAIKHT